MVLKHRDGINENWDILSQMVGPTVMEDLALKLELSKHTFKQEPTVSLMQVANYTEIRWYVHLIELVAIAEGHAHNWS